MAKNRKLIFIIGLLCLLCPVSVLASTDPDAIVKQADEIRFPTTPFQISVRVTTHSPGDDAKVHEYQVLQKGHDNSVVRTMAPASDRGQVMLLKGPDLWIFLPAVSQPVRLPLSQRLTGQVANGDLARANFSGDYAAKVLRSENIDDKPHHVLELTAARKGVTYHRVLYWVDEQTNQPRRVEFYTKSGRLMKSGEYSEYTDMGGVMRPSKLTLTDALREGEYSVLEYRKLKKRKIADKVFTKQFLKKLDR